MFNHTSGHGGFDFGERLAELSRRPLRLPCFTAEQGLLLAVESGDAAEIEDAACEYLMVIPEVSKEPLRIAFRCDFCRIGLTDGVHPCSHCGCVFVPVEAVPKAELAVTADTEGYW